MRRIVVLIALALLATATWAASDPVTLPDGRTLEVYRPGQDGVTRPLARTDDRVVPAYPMLASPLGAESSVVFAIVVDENGDAQKLEVVEASHPDLGFEDAGADALFRWKFDPAEKDGEPVPSTTMVRLRFPEPRRGGSFVGGFNGGIPGTGVPGLAGTAGKGASALGGGRLGGSADAAAGAASGPGDVGTARLPGEKEGISRGGNPLGGIREGQVYFRGHPEWGNILYGGEHLPKPD